MEKTLSVIHTYDDAARTRTVDNQPLQALANRAVRKVLDYIGAAIVGAVAISIGGWAFAHLDSNIKTPDWVILIFALAVVIVVSIVVARAERRAKVQHRTVQLVELDESLLSLFLGFVRDPDRDEAVKKLLYEFLRDATRLFGKDVSRGSILRRDGDSETLVVWVAYQMPPESQQRTHFNIGVSAGTGRGIAGETYADHTVRVVHMVERNGGWIAESYKEVNGKWVHDDDAHYVKFDSTRPHPPYRSFATVPVISASQECLGVLCFDSTNLRAFDAPEIRQLLVSLGTRVAAVAVLYQHLGSSDPPPKRKRPPRTV